MSEGIPSTNPEGAKKLADYAALTEGVSTILIDVTGHVAVFDEYVLNKNLVAATLS